MKWLIIGLFALGLIGAVIWWLVRKRRGRHRLISFVALLKEPVSFDPAVLASVAGKAWDADLGTGDNEGDDGFIAGADITHVIQCRGRMYLVNSFPTPYVEQVKAAAAEITDKRIRDLFRKHEAWFSCDAMGIDRSTPEDEVRKEYRRLAKLFVELLDDNCLLIFLPDTHGCYLNSEETENALRSKDPVAALQESLYVPIIEVSNDDPRMKKAVEIARKSFPNFVNAFEEQAGENFSVKAPVTRGGNTEFIWLTVTSIEGEKIYGELANDPGNLGNLKLGSKVSVDIAELNDWIFMDPEGEMAGGFTIEAVAKAAKKKRSTSDDEE